MSEKSDLCPVAVAAALAVVHKLNEKLDAEDVDRIAPLIAGVYRTLQPRRKRCIMVPPDATSEELVRILEASDGELIPIRRPPSVEVPG